MSAATRRVRRVTRHTCHSHRCRWQQRRFNEQQESIRQTPLCYDGSPCNNEAVNSRNEQNASVPTKL